MRTANRLEKQALPHFSGIFEAFFISREYLLLRTSAGAEEIFRAPLGENDCLRAPDEGVFARIQAAVSQNDLNVRFKARVKGQYHGTTVWV
jgi:hypothetical protein